jgi:hypothetical protein
VTDRLDLIYRSLDHPVAHEALLERLIAEVNTPWFSRTGVTDQPTMKVVTRCHQILCDQKGSEEYTLVMSLIHASRLWERQSNAMGECPAKHLLKWNATLIQSALLDAFA